MIIVGVIISVMFIISIMINMIIIISSSSSSSTSSRYQQKTLTCRTDDVEAIMLFHSDRSSRSNKHNEQSGGVQSNRDDI